MLKKIWLSNLALGVVVAPVGFVAQCSSFTSTTPSTKTDTTMMQEHYTNKLESDKTFNLKSN